ncbi:MAG: DUF1573 domain-containing protein [Chlorobi bacterium]|nr:DUF1573 domain-containing protein [Chlorobiota bacterium]
MKKIFKLTVVAVLMFTSACSQTGVNTKSAEMTFKEDLTFDFGKIKQYGNGTHKFIFKNTGKAPLIITNVKSSCGCTVPTYPENPVKKGETAEISVKYDTGKTGVFTKTITVYSNAKNSPVILHIKGEVIKTEK